MFLTTPGWVEALLVGSAAAGGVLIGRGTLQRALRRQAAEWEARLRTEQATGQQFCFATLESLASAIEASHTYDLRSLRCMQQTVVALARSLALPEAEANALRAAALLHNVGRLGVPEHILHKSETLTTEEQTILHTIPVLSAQLLASVPFPWEIAALVRHHTECWDGSGYPDGLNGTAIPHGARILAVASAYSALRYPPASRTALSAFQAMNEIESRSGKAFDPDIVAALRRVTAEAEPSSEQTLSGVHRAALPESNGLAASLSPGPAATTRSALKAIADAQRETIGLFHLAQSVTESLHLEAIGDALLNSTRALVPCAAAVLFLAEDTGEFLRAHAAAGANARHLLGSLARIGTFLTGRAFSRGEITRASFLFNDLILRDVSDAWTPFRSTLIVPLTAEGQTLGTLNLYSEEPDAFGDDTLRVMRLIAAPASRALHNARRFAAVQETAYTDAMTGLRNARFLREFLEREINRSRREQTPLAVLNIDLDNFKPINDRFGHARGDETLREIAEILHSHVRNYDLAARYAGDEFVVVLSRAGRIPAETVAAKLKRAVRQHSERIIAREPNFPQLGVSVGIALFPDDADDLQGLLCRSDAAMYVDKQNRVPARPSGEDGRQVVSSSDALHSS